MSRRNASSDAWAGFRATNALVRLSQLIVDAPEVCELDVNPLLADQFGVMALDARIRVEKADKPGAERLAIRPYPKELEETIPLGDGRALLLRPILPEDEPSLQNTFAKLTPEEVRLRFSVPLRTLDHVTAARFIQIDYDSEMVRILTEPGIAGRTEIYGVVRIIADPDNERAEYAIIVRHDMTGMGLGVLLMRRILDYAKRRGIREIFRDVLQENRTMLRLCDVLGFTLKRAPDEPEIVRVILNLETEEIGDAGSGKTVSIAEAEEYEHGWFRRPTPPGSDHSHYPWRSVSAL